MRQMLQVWHPDSPGMKVWVVRGWWGRLLKSKHFATLSETQIYNQRKVSL